MYANQWAAINDGGRVRFGGGASAFCGPSGGIERLRPLEARRLLAGHYLREAVSDYFRENDPNEAPDDQLPF